MKGLKQLTRNCLRPFLAANETILGVGTIVVVVSIQDGCWSGILGETIPDCGIKEL